MNMDVWINFICSFNIMYASLSTFGFLLKNKQENEQKYFNFSLSKSLELKLVNKDHHMKISSSFTSI